MAVGASLAALGLVRRQGANLRRQLKAKDEVIAGQKAVVEELLRQRNEVMEQKRRLVERTMWNEASLWEGKDIIKAERDRQVQQLASAFGKLQEAQQEKVARTDSGAEVDVERFRKLQVVGGDNGSRKGS